MYKANSSALKPSHKMHDPFLEIYTLTKQRKFIPALQLLANPKTHQLNPPFRADTSHAWYCIGDIFYRQGDFELARDSFRKALRIWPEDTDALMAMGNCYAELARARLAERYFRKALLTTKNRGKKSHSIMFNLANSLFDQNRFSDACEIYNRLIRLRTEVASVARKNMRLAKIYMQGA